MDHIADYLKFISKAQSFWFMLNKSYDHGCHLASRFCLEPNNYEVLLVFAGLALYTKLGFAIKPTAWRKFLGGHQFAVDNCAIEFEQKKIDINAYIDGARVMPEPMADATAEIIAEATADAMVEVTAKATAEAVAEVTEGGGVTRVDATISRTRGARGCNERRRCNERRLRRRTGGGGVTRGDATTSRIRGVRLSRLLL